MERRNFVAGLAAMIAAPKSLIARASDRPLPVPQPAAYRPSVATGKRPSCACKAFVKRYDLELYKSVDSNAVVFTLDGPAPNIVARWSTGVRAPSPSGQPDSEALQRQLQYQLAKAMQGIEREHGWRGVPPAFEGYHWTWGRA